MSNQAAPNLVMPDQFTLNQATSEARSMPMKTRPMRSQEAMPRPQLAHPVSYMQQTCNT